MNSKRRKGKKKPYEHWTRAYSNEDKIRLMIIEGYTAKEINKFANAKLDLIENIADKYEIVIRDRGDGDKSYFEFINVRNDTRSI